MIAAWLGVCLALLVLASCSVQRPVLQTAKHYRLTLVLAPGSEPGALNQLLSKANAINADIRPYQDGYELDGRAKGPRALMLTFRTAADAGQFRRDVLEMGLPLLSLHMDETDI